MGFAAIYWRDMIKFFRNKALLFSALIQPVLWLVLYGISMSSNINLFYANSSAPLNTTSVSYMTFMTAGVVGMTILFTCLYSGQNIQFDKQYGLMKEIVVSPMPRSQILLGETLAGITKALIQATIVILFGYVLGVQFFFGLTGSRYIYCHRRRHVICSVVFSWFNVSFNCNCDEGKRPQC